MCSGPTPAVWCGICGSTEHRSADCDCWAQWGADAGSPGEMSEDNGVEGLSDSSDDSEQEEGEWMDIASRGVNRQS